MALQAFLLPSYVSSHSSHFKSFYSSPPSPNFYYYYSKQFKLLLYHPFSLTSTPPQDDYLFTGSDIVDWICRTIALPSIRDRQSAVAFASKMVSSGIIRQVKLKPIVTPSQVKETETPANRNPFATLMTNIRARGHTRSSSHNKTISSEELQEIAKESDDFCDDVIVSYELLLSENLIKKILEQPKFTTGLFSCHFCFIILQYKNKAINLICCT